MYSKTEGLGVMLHSTWAVRKPKWAGSLGERSHGFVLQHALKPGLRGNMMSGRCGSHSKNKKQRKYVWMEKKTKQKKGCRPDSHLTGRLKQTAGGAALWSRPNSCWFPELSWPPAPHGTTHPLAHISSCQKTVFPWHTDLYCSSMIS